jgi:RNA polymerase sigma factor (sigma-70 family)
VSNKNSDTTLFETITRIVVTDWKEKTLAHWDSINKMAARRFGEGTLAEEAALAVMDGLSADDWRRIAAFGGRSSFSSFVMTLTARLLEDFARKRFGRVRPPLWVKSLGGIWEKLFTTLCLERLRPVEAVEVVLQRHVQAIKKEVEKAAYQLLAKIPGCGKSQGVEVTYEEGMEHSGDTSVEGRGIEEGEKKKLFSMVCQLIFSVDDIEISSGFQEKFKALKIRLSSEEQLLLRLCFQDDLNVTEAGKMLGLTRFQVHGKMRRLMQRLKKEFERVGLDDELLLFLN